MWPDGLGRPWYTRTSGVVFVLLQECGIALSWVLLSLVLLHAVMRARNHSPRQCQVQAKKGTLHVSIEHSWNQRFLGTITLRRLFGYDSGLEWLLGNPIQDMESKM